MLLMMITTTTTMTTAVCYFLLLVDGESNNDNANVHLARLDALSASRTRTKTRLVVSYMFSVGFVFVLLCKLFLSTCSNARDLAPSSSFLNLSNFIHPFSAVVSAS